MQQQCQCYFIPTRPTLCAWIDFPCHVLCPQPRVFHYVWLLCNLVPLAKNWTARSNASCWPIATVCSTLHVLHMNTVKNTWLLSKRLKARGFAEAFRLCLRFLEPSGAEIQSKKRANLLRTPSLWKNVTLKQQFSQRNWMVWRFYLD